MKRTFQLFVIALTVGACSGSKPDANMSYACQMVKCECASSNSSMFKNRKTVDPQWKRSGEPYCPKNFALRRTPPP